MSSPNYMVHWKARVLTPDKVIRDGVISQIRKGGFSLDYPMAVGVGTEVAVEFYVTYRNEPRRMRVKAKVIYCMLRSQSSGARLKLSITKMSPEENHVYNNILQIFGDSDEFNLQV